MKTTINQRIAAIIDNSGLTLTAFSRKIGIAQTSLRECVVNNTEPKFTTLYKIIKAEPGISHTWLLTGEGEMLNIADKTNSDNDLTMNDRIEAILELKLKGSRSGNGFSLTFSGGTLNIEGK